MRSATLLTAGSWALALLVGAFCWLSPDSGYYPRPAVATLVVGAAFLLWIVGAARTGMPRQAPRLPFRTQVGALAPLFAATLALVLAGRGLLPLPALPTFFILLVGGGIWWWADRKPGAPTTTTQESLLGVLLIPPLLILLPTLMLAVWGQTLWLMGTPNYSRLIERYNAASALAPFRPMHRAGISPDAAGLALVAIGNTGTPRRDPLLVAPPAALDRAWLPDSGPFGAMPGDSVMRRALAGLSPRERAWLQQVVTHPGLALVDTVAYAGKLDPWAALKLPLPEEVNPFSLPTPGMMGIRNAARLALYRAALATADHRPAVADSLVREVIGFGLRLHDDSDQLIGALIGTAIAREAAASLAELRTATGKTADAETIRTALAGGGGVTLFADLDPSLDPPVAIRHAIIAAVMANAAPRPVEWELAASLGIAPCTDLRELLYGPAPHLEAAYDVASERVEDSPHAQAAFAVVRRGIAGVAPQGEVPLLFRPAAWALGRAHAGVCVSSGTIS